MINMAVISLKDIIKYLVKITIVILIVVGLTRYFLSIKNNAEKSRSTEISDETKSESENNNTENGSTNKNDNENSLEDKWKSFLSCLDISIPAIAQVNNKENNSSPKENKTIEDILSVNLGVIDNLKSESNNKQMADKNLENNNVGENNEVDSNTSSENIEHAGTDVKTEVLESSVSAKYSQEYYGVKIRNETDYKLTNEVLDPTSLEINTDNIIIYHTHSCESYTSSEKY